MTDQPINRPPPWWDPETQDYRPDIEEIARVIDPEAFGLEPWRATHADHQTERDEARDKACAILRRKVPHD